MSYCVSLMLYVQHMTSDFCHTLHQYATDISATEPPLLAALRQATCKEIAGSQMLSSPLQGRLLAFLSTLVQPKKILEIGTYTGYSALCLSEGLPKEGVLHTIERAHTLKDFSRSYFEKGAKAAQIISHIGLAADIIPLIEGPFDLVFIDADKRSYGRYYDLVIDHLSPHGLIIADNVLWKGKVLDKKSRQEDNRADALADFCEKVQQDRRVTSLCLPICDGLLLIQKNSA